MALTGRFGMVAGDGIPGRFYPARFASDEFMPSLSTEQFYEHMFPDL
jgi:hypothetical protein